VLRDRSSEARRSFEVSKGAYKSEGDLYSSRAKKLPARKPTTIGSTEDILEHKRKESTKQ